MMLSSGQRKCALAAHLVFAVGWVGAALAYLALATAVDTSRSDETIRGSWIAMEITGWFVIVPLAVGTLITGLVMSLGTRWGLLRHYWVLFSLVLTSFATGVLVLHMPTVSSLAGRARTAEGGALAGLGTDLAHPGIGLFVLLVVLALNVFKPKGLTRYGQRRLAEERTEARHLFP